MLTLISVVMRPNTTGFKLHLFGNLRSAAMFGLDRSRYQDWPRSNPVTSRQNADWNKSSWMNLDESVECWQSNSQRNIRRHPIRADDALLTAISSGLYADWSPAYDAEELEQTHMMD